jgi:2-polyprenyl-3-methyl-5-hydroxy-6-metoxy-1,4-benzoquinol methylase
MPDLNSLEKFNQFYTQEIERAYESSLVSFFNSQITSRLPKDPMILDIGSGSKSIFEDLKVEGALITAIDFSSVAITKAQSHSLLNYELRDITKDHSIEENTYDLIFDSHCLHCITNPKERDGALNNIYNGLKADGIFCAEMMVSPLKKEVELPFKYVRPAFDLEQELLNNKFVIKYFMIVRDLKFENANGECELLRVIATK